jgi:hypothetical protein
MDTSRDYARKEWLDPVSEVEREALSKGFIRGVLFTVAILVATFIVTEVLVGMTRHVLVLVRAWI